MLDFFVTQFGRKSKKVKVKGCLFRKIRYRISGLMPKGHQLYDGPYHGGRAVYSYYLDSDQMRVFDGLFRYENMFINRDNTKVINEARGSFRNGLKHGTWNFFCKDADRKMRLTVHYVGGKVDGEIVYESEEQDINSRPSHTKLFLSIMNGLPIGEVVGMVKGNTFRGMLDKLGMPHGAWISNREDTENGEWQEVEHWNHGRLESAERNLFTYGRREQMRPYMRNQVNWIIESINQAVLPIVRHGSTGRLMYVCTA